MTVPYPASSVEVGPEQTRSFHALASRFDARTAPALGLPGMRDQGLTNIVLRPPLDQWAAAAGGNRLHVAQVSAECCGDLDGLGLIEQTAALPHGRVSSRADSSWTRHPQLTAEVTRNGEYLFTRCNASSRRARRLRCSALGVERHSS
jgi:hypothetical protein